MKNEKRIKLLPLTTLKPFLYSLLFLLGTYTLSAQGNYWANFAKDQNIYAIAQQGDILWIGTEGGLVKKNQATGERQILLPSNSPMAGYWINTITIADDGTVWIGGVDGGLQKYDGTNWEQFRGTGSGEIFREVHHVEIAENGDLWFAAVLEPGTCSSPCRKIFRFDGTTFTDMESELGVYDQLTASKNQIEATTDGNVWLIVNEVVRVHDGNAVIQSYTAADIGMTGGDYPSRVIQNEHLGMVVASRGSTAANEYLRFWQLNGTTWSEIEIDGQLGISGAFVKLLLNDNEDNLYICYTDYTSSDNDQVVVEYDGSDWQSWEQDDLPNLPNGYGSNLIHVGDQGHWWSTIGSEDFFAPELYEFDGNNWTPQNTSIYPFPSALIQNAMTDCEGNYWFAGHDGVTKYDGYIWTNYLLEDFNIDADYISAWEIVLDSSTCDIWVSFNDNNGDGTGLAKINADGISTYSSPGAHDIGDIEFGPEGKLWAEISQEGLGSFDGTTWEIFNDTNSPISTSSISEFEFDANGHLWVKSFYAEVLKYDGTTWTTYDLTNSPVDDYTGFLMYGDRLGNMWFSNEQSFYKFDGTDWTNYTLPGTDNYFYGIAQAENGLYWVAGSKGFYKWDGTNFTVYDSGNSDIYASGTRSIEIDQFNNKWIRHSRGFSLFNEEGIKGHAINPPVSISGQVFFDANQDGQAATTTEPGIANERLLLLPDSITTFTNTNGAYTFFLPDGAYEVEYVPDSAYSATSLSPLAANLDGIDLTNVDFGAWSATPPQSLAVSITGSNIRCNDDFAYWLTIQNEGPFSHTVNISLEYDPVLVFESASIPPTLVTNNTITWIIEDFGGYAYEGIEIEFQGPDETFIGSILVANLQVEQSDNGNPLNSFTDETRDLVTCSYDPNDKLVEPTGASYNDQSLSAQPLEYTIRFQNTGNDTAFLVTLIDTIDSQLDINSFRFIGSSHPTEITITNNNILTFRFSQINLLWEDIDHIASQGFVKYEITAKAGIPLPADIENTAHIYFDFNPAITTNTTESTVVLTFDQDDDGFDYWLDCDDTNPLVNADATEIAYNGLDDDCNELTLDDDFDQDGFNLIDDCDDNDPLVNNAPEEPYNGIDDDCNELTLDDDLDQDGFINADDCDDNNPNVNASIEEIPYNGLDDDCNELTLDDDFDQDGFNLIDDCDDNDPLVNNSPEEPYNGIDDDCNELTLDDDLDQDGYMNAEDCDDNNPLVNIGEEIPYNGLDDDCNEATLDDDFDQDGFNLIDDCDDNDPLVNNAPEEPYNGLDDDCNELTLDDDLDQDGYVNAEDCDDNNPLVNIGEEVPYNGLDDDCDEATLDDDLDQDGFDLIDDCDDNDPLVNNSPEEPYNGIDDDCNELTLDDDLDQDGYVNAEDCDDNNPLVNIGEEIPYNGLDDDCDEATFDDDLDQDGFGIAEDCDDNDPLVNNAPEEPYNGLDDDCDETTLDDDLDQDGYVNAEDCDDNNPLVNIGEEIPYNGLDDDCDEATFDDDLDQDSYGIDEDCDDSDPLVNIGVEIPYNGLDDDCDEITLDDDLDLDGFGIADDCDDENPAINTAADEIPNNGIDEDCDGEDLLIGTDNILTIKPQVFPNPTTGILQITFSEAIAGSYELRDLTGRLLLKSDFNKETKIDMTKLSGNLYLLFVKTEKGQWVERIVKI